MFPLMEHNIAKNELNGRVKPAVLNWCVSCDFFPQTSNPPPGANISYARVRAKKYVPAAT